MQMIFSFFAAYRPIAKIGSTSQEYKKTIIFISAMTINNDDTNYKAK